MALAHSEPVREHAYREIGIVVMLADIVDRCLDIPVVRSRSDIQRDKGLLQFLCGRRGVRMEMQEFLYRCLELALSKGLEQIIGDS